MSNDQQIIVPANHPDDFSTEQPPKFDAAACLVQPPKFDAAACLVQPPNDDAACPVPLPNDEAEIMNAVMSSNDDDAADPAPLIKDDAAGPAPPLKDDADLAPPPNNHAAEMSSQDDDAGSAAPPPNNDAGLSSPPNIDAGPALPSKEDAMPAPPPKDYVNTARPTFKIHVPKRPNFRNKARPRFYNKPGCSRDNGSAAKGGNGSRVDIKKEIKHETIDLGNDTYFYDDNNKPILIRGRSKVGFDRGLAPDHIIGATEEDGKLMFLIAWKNSEIADLLEAREVYEKAPQIAIKFFEARLRYCKVTD